VQRPPLSPPTVKSRTVHPPSARSSDEPLTTHKPDVWAPGVSGEGVSAQAISGCRWAPNVSPPARARSRSGGLRSGWCIGPDWCKLAHEWGSLLSFPLTFFISKFGLNSNFKFEHCIDFFILQSYCEMRIQILEIIVYYLYFIPFSLFSFSKPYFSTLGFHSTSSIYYLIVIILIIFI
jgi:hypothetical protein